MEQQKQQYCSSNDILANSNGSKNKNYINVNVVPMAISNSNVQYHSRRKYSPSQVTTDYQSRVYFGDYIRRGDDTSNSYYAIPQPQNTTQSVATSTNDEGNGNGNSNNNSLIISPPTSLQLHQQSAQSSNTSNQQQQTITPVLYRVVPTNYGNNSNASSLTSIITRNEADGTANNNGPNSSTNNYQQVSQMASAQEANHQQQQQQQQQHPQLILSNISNSNNSNYNNNYSGGGTVAITSSSGFSAATNSTIARPMQKVIPTVVYLMSRIAVHMEIEGTAQCPSQVMLAAALGCEELGISNKLLAQSVFGLWMTSSLLEIQLKPHHRPYSVRIAWPNLLERNTHGNELEKCSDEPMCCLRRNVFYSRRDEEKIKDPRILELLYEEARHNVLLGRYIMEPAHLLMLGGIQARIELGPYNIHTHTVSFFRENQFRFLPSHVAKSTNWSWLPYSRQNSAEVRLLEQFKRIPTTATTRKLMRKYLEFCWALPFYGAGFFHGQVEQPIRGLMSLFQQKDIPVLIAINEKGIYIIDHVECTLLLGLKYEDFSWDYGKPPTSSDDVECVPCFFIQFSTVENGIAVTKLMQIFSRQAAMMDGLVSHFAEQMRRRKEEPDPIDNNVDDEPHPIQNNGGVLSNKFSRLTLATFDDEGRCIGQMGSLLISY